MQVISLFYKLWVLINNDAVLPVQPVVANECRVILPFLVYFTSYLVDSL